MTVRTLRLGVVFGCGLRESVDACSFARSGLAPPDDATHARALGGSKPDPVLPNPISLANNAFVSHSLLDNNPLGQSSHKTLLETLQDVAADRGEELCYWSYQALPPPKGGPSVFHPFRKYWDMQDGSHDQDLEWVEAYGEVAVSRLHDFVKPDGPVMLSMGASGSEMATRRCATGRARARQCGPSVTGSNLTWPMAIAIFKINHPDLASTVLEWRASAHLPNIAWTFNAGMRPIRSRLNGRFNHGGAMPEPGETNPAGMPQGNYTDFPASKDGFILRGSHWGDGAPMLAKVVKCSDVPSKLRYSEEQYYMDHVAEGALITTADEGYAVWKSLVGVWPPSEECKDDLDAANALLVQWSLEPAANCQAALLKLQEAVPNAGCDTPTTFPLFRDLCCSVCGSSQIPVVPPPAPPAPAPTMEHHHCMVCKHVYDPERDGGGAAFEDLPSTWKCPICGAPRTSYMPTEVDGWEHEASVLL